MNLNEARKSEKQPIEAHLFNAATVILFIVVALQVFTRLFLNRSLSWTEEFSRYFFIWGSYFSVSVAAYHGRHIRISAHISLMPEIVQKVILSVSDIIWMVFNIVVIYNSILFNFSMFRYPLRSETLGFNLVWIYMIIPIGFSFLTVRVFMNFVRRLKGNVDITDQRKNL